MKDPDLPSRPNSHRWWLAGLVIVFVIRGLFWAGTTQLLSPIDELQHADYVAALAAGDGVPVVGESKVRPELMRVAKFAHSSGSRIAPTRPTAEDERWGPTAESYEAFQGPLYYALVAPAWKLGAQWGTRTAIYAARAASVVLTSLAILVAYALARRLFPRRQEVWLAAPAVIALAMGTAANPSALSNDALVLPLAGAALVPIAASLGLARPQTLKSGLVTGLLVGLCVVSKSNCIALVPLIGLGAFAASWQQGRAWRRLGEFLAGAAVAGAVTLAPWIAWNLHAYDAISADDAVDAITGPLQPFLPFGVESVRYHLGQAFYGFWDMQLTAPAKNPPALLLFGACALLGAAALIRRRRDLREAASLGFVAAAFPLAFLTMLAVIFITFGGRSSVTGRHMYPAFVAVAVLLAAGALITFGRQVGLIVLSALALVSLNNDIGATDRYVSAAYETLLLDNLSPARPLAAGAALADGGTAVLVPPCEASAVGVVAASEPPETLSVAIDGAVTAAPRIGDLRQQNVRSVALYRVEPPTRRPIVITADTGSTLVHSQSGPIVEAWCARKDARAARFAQTFSSEHPGVLTRRVVQLWPRLWFTSGWLLLALAVGSAVRERLRDRQGRPA